MGRIDSASLCKGYPLPGVVEETRCHESYQSAGFRMYSRSRNTSAERVKTELKLQCDRNELKRSSFSERPLLSILMYKLAVSPLLFHPPELCQNLGNQNTAIGVIYGRVGAVNNGLSPWGTGAKCANRTGQYGNLVRATGSCNAKDFSFCW